MQYNLLMDIQSLERTLADLPIGALRYFERIGSTNDEAISWAEEGASDMSMVVADEQTAGRGRRNRDWFTPAGAALAFSLVVRPPLCTTLDSSRPRQFPGSVSRLTALGALSISDALRKRYHLDCKIKWPNDVLVDGRKLAGVLVEITWVGDQLTAAVLGMGINVAPASVPAENSTTTPATCVETALGRQVSRLNLLQSTVSQVLKWRLHLDSDNFQQAWENKLAYRGEWVNINPENGIKDQPPAEGKVLGLDLEGCLILRSREGHLFTLRSSAYRITPITWPLPAAADQSQKKLR
jgi:BirA family biotin operon repressor/biotin-[acetyl-CoA-carboxylase] ligase